MPPIWPKFTDSGSYQFSKLTTTSTGSIGYSDSVSWDNASINEFESKYELSLNSASLLKRFLERICST
ncbi:hypothetical protein BpHYR1_012451 [Brachionus plicatilis]|uniref:Uncharacterized protein n=1 Tax=Brachionus plicatilis TaxID=10195 RepID=A0A3M7P4P8_BRAPC|nr:hypothetical protein BpHYR1_012451 [Brachionus plicatilis]